MKKNQERKKIYDKRGFIDKEGLTKFNTSLNAKIRDTLKIQTDCVNKVIDSVVIRENDRVLNEKSRLESENIRINSEQYRVTNEQKRVSDERKRVVAEDVRIANEILSENNESERVRNEFGRDNREYDRVVAENARQEGYLKYSNDVSGMNQRFDAIDGINTVQNEDIKDIKYVNKRQDVVIGGLLNEGNDGRLSIEGVGNSIKLENSEDGLIEVGKVVGDTMVNVAMRDIYKWPQECTLNINGDYGVVIAETRGNVVVGLIAINEYKPNTSYTLFIDELPSNGYIVVRDPINAINLTITSSMLNVVNFTTIDKPSNELFVYYMNVTNNTRIKIRNNINAILEGDYTNKPIPTSYFEGMQSTFEDKLVTQKMIDKGEENVEHLGKYKVEVEVVGKNKFYGAIERGRWDISNGSPSPNTEYVRSIEFIHIPPNKNIKCSHIFDNKQGSYVHLQEFDVNKNFIKDTYSDRGEFTTGTTTMYVRLSLYLVVNVDSVDRVKNIQLEEGTVSTQYEPYKSHKQATYLNSPLLKGDEIRVENGMLGHWHNRIFSYLNDFNDIVLDITRENTLTFRFIDSANKYKGNSKLISDKFTYGVNVYDVDIEGVYYTSVLRLNISKTKLTTQDVAGFKKWLQDNPITVIYELAEPYFEPLLELPKWILDSYNDCTVTFNTNIPVANSSFKYTGNIPSVFNMEDALKCALSGDMQGLAYCLYPQDFLYKNMIRGDKQ